MGKRRSRRIQSEVARASLARLQDDSPARAKESDSFPAGQQSEQRRRGHRLPCATVWPSRREHLKQYKVSITAAPGPCRARPSVITQDTQHGHNAQKKLDCRSDSPLGATSKALTTSSTCLVFCLAVTRQPSAARSPLCLILQTGQRQALVL